MATVLTPLGALSYIGEKFLPPTRMGTGRSFFPRNVEWSRDVSWDGDKDRKYTPRLQPAPLASPIVRVSI